MRNITCERNRETPTPERIGIIETRGTKNEINFMHVCSAVDFIRTRPSLHYRKYCWLAWIYDWYHTLTVLGGGSKQNDKYLLKLFFCSFLASFHCPLTDEFAMMYCIEKAISTKKFNKPQPYYVILTSCLLKKRVFVVGRGGGGVFRGGQSFT